MIELPSDPAVWASFLTLTVLEIVLGVDNVILIPIAAARLPEAQRPRDPIAPCGGRTAPLCRLHPRRRA